jgi:rubrerythrin
VRLGSFHLRRWKGQGLINGERKVISKNRVVFVRGLTLREELKRRYNMADEEMCKYGVDESLTLPEDEKLSSASAVCHKCGTKIEIHGRVRVCPKCGTAPFEGEE